MINKNNLFNLFPEPDDLDNKSNEDIEIQITESAHHKIIMFRKIINNHLVFFKQYELHMKKVDPKFSADDSKAQASFVVFNRAWSYIKDIDVYKKAHVKDIELHDPYDLAYCLQLTIKYFETTEQYERCAHLFKIQKLLEDLAK